ncbi:THUMP domain [Fragilaria crotonensis]|nr:THUMP domain [Fragilaria crotonensis]
MSTLQGDDCQDDVYLAPVPRGLHHVAISVIERELADFVVFVGEPVVNNDEYCTNLQGRLQKEYGSLFDDQTLNKHVSVGYHKEKNIWCTSGVWEGSVWVKFVTNAPASKVQSIPVLGPLLACVRMWDLQDSSRMNTTMQEAIRTIKHLFQLDYPFDTAFDLWKRHSRNWSRDYQIPTSIHYRASCIRGHSKEYNYSREDFLIEVADLMVPDTKAWKVDLVHYDVEVVLLMISPRCVAVGLTLRPYQLLGTKGFQCNVMPPDTSLPYISGKLTTGITRLRPVNARLLIELANVQDGDVVLDPCCGIGTIPLNITNGVGIGGDLSLLPNGLAVLAGTYLNEFGRSNPSTNLCAWDASCLPLRPGSIDVVVTDLPFGKLCLSSNKLYQLLPLWFSELARVLRPGTGRAVILCGAIGIVGDALSQINEARNCNWDVASVFPVNVGGLLAWIVIADRTNTPPIALMNHQRRLRKQTAAREQTSKRRKRQTVTKRTKDVVEATAYSS